MRGSPHGVRRLLALVVVAACAAPSIAAAQDDNPLSFRPGRAVEVGLRASLRADARDVGLDDGDAPDVFAVSRARVGLDLTLWQRLEVQVEREFRDAPQPWRDAYADLELTRALSIRGGRFKVPFSTERMNSGLEVDFVYRALASSQLSPVRDTGVMVHGEVLRRRLRYQAGLFRNGGEGGEVGEDAVRAAEDDRPLVSGRTFAGRVAVTPWGRARTRALRDLEFASAYTTGTVPEGLNGVASQTVFGERLFPRLVVSGRRTRVNGALTWRHGPVSVAGELTRVEDQRLGQGTDDDDLPPLTASGWFVRSTWLVTGERKEGRITPAHPVLHGGAGALEAAVRLETVRLGSPDGGEPRSTSPRARSAAQTSERAWTFGLNWYLTRYLKVQLNLVREQRNAEAAAITGQARVWSRVVRMQVGL